MVYLGGGKYDTLKGEVDINEILEIVEEFLSGDYSEQRLFLEKFDDLFEKVRDEAYEEGYNDGKDEQECDCEEIYEEEYEQGYSDGKWDTLKNIAIELGLEVDFSKLDEDYLVNLIKNKIS